MLIFLIVHQFISIDTNELSDSTNVLSEIFVSTVLLAITSSFILVVECLFTNELKDKLSYLFSFFGLLKLPGYTIFSKIKKRDNDNRFSHKHLMSKYPELYQNLPKEKKARERYENEQWYVIYSKNRDVPMVYNSQRDWLLCRDIYVSTLVIIGLYVVVVTIVGFTEINYPYLFFLIIMAVITNFGANRKANRFAYNVIAYDVSKR